MRRVRGQIERLVDATVAGAPAVAVRERMAALEARRLALEGELASAQGKRARVATASAA